MMPRDEQKRTYRAYRERARDLFEKFGVDGDGDIIKVVRIAEYANVQLCQDGAYVEAVVWVPASALLPPTHEG